jgi:hypothetical protein
MTLDRAARIGVLPSVAVGLLRLSVLALLLGLITPGGPLT